MKKILTLLILALTTFSIAELRIPEFIGATRFDVGKKFLLNGKEYQFTFLDGMLLEDGTYSLKIDGKDYKVTIDTTPPEGRISPRTEGLSFVSDKTVRFYNPKNRGGIFVATGNEYRLKNELLLVVLEDEVGNVADATCTPPLLEKLDILDSRSPVTNISGRKFLLASRSPYRLLGRSVIPENSAIILENGAVLQHTLNSTVIIKGLFFSMGESTILGAGELSLTDKGMLYLSGQADNTNITSDGGALVCLNEVSVGSINLNYTNYVVLRKVNTPYVKISSSYAVYIIDSNVAVLEIENCANVYVNNSVIGTLNISVMTNARIYSSYIDSSKISDLSVVNLIKSTLGKLAVERGTVAKLKSSKVNEIRISDYAIAYAFKTKIAKIRQENGRLHNVK